MTVRDPAATRDFIEEAGWKGNTRRENRLAKIRGMGRQRLTQTPSGLAGRNDDPRFRKVERLASRPTASQPLYSLTD